MTKSKNILQVVRFKPYLPGSGPVFRLTTWDANRTGYGGKHIVGYRLSMGETDKLGRVAVWNVIFEGEDFGCSPLHAIDSDATIAGIMRFLTLRPGDTDREYFENYTPEQLAYCSEHAEALSCCVSDRFGDL